MNQMIEKLLVQIFLQTPDIELISKEASFDHYTLSPHYDTHTSASAHHSLRCAETIYQEENNLIIAEHNQKLKKEGRACSWFFPICFLVATTIKTALLSTAFEKTQLTLLRIELFALFDNSHQHWENLNR